MATPRRKGTIGDVLDPLDPAGESARLAVVDALAEGCTIKEAAERAGVARQTASFWINTEDDLRLMLAERRKELAKDHHAKLSRLHGQVLDRLGQALDNPSITTAEVVSIAKALGPAFTAADTADISAPSRVLGEIRARAFSDQWSGSLTFD